MVYLGIAVIAIIVLYKIFGKKILMNKMIERITVNALKYSSDSNSEIVTAMYFYYACLVLTCQSRNLSTFTKVLVNKAFRKSISDAFNFQELPQDVYMRDLKCVFSIVELLKQSNNSPEVLMSLLINKSKTDSKLGLLSFDASDVYEKASIFYVCRVGPTVDFLLETSKHYPD